MCTEGFEIEPVWGCKPCPRGTYSDVKDAESCTPCPEGQTTHSDRSKTVNSCNGKKNTVF